MKDYGCKYCESTDVFIDETRHQPALCCGDCGRFLKWIGNKELPIVKRYIESKKITQAEITVSEDKPAQEVKKPSSSKKKYLVLCNRHNSSYGDNWCLFWGNRERKCGYSSDIRIAHRFDESEIVEFDDDGDIPIPIDVLGISEDYESEEGFNDNIKVMIEKGTLNELLGLKLKKIK